MYLFVVLLFIAAVLGYLIFTGHLSVLSVSYLKNWWYFSPPFTPFNHLPVQPRCKNTKEIIVEFPRQMVHNAPDMFTYPARTHSKLYTTTIETNDSIAGQPFFITSTAI